MCYETVWLGNVLMTTHSFNRRTINRSSSSMLWWGRNDDYASLTLHDDDELGSVQRIFYAGRHTYTYIHMKRTKNTIKRCKLKCKYLLLLWLANCGRCLCASASGMFAWSRNFLRLRFTSCRINAACWMWVPWCLAEKRRLDFKFSFLISRDKHDEQSFREHTFVATKYLPMGWTMVTLCGCALAQHSMRFRWLHLNNYFAKPFADDQRQWERLAAARVLRFATNECNLSSHYRFKWIHLRTVYGEMNPRSKNRTTFVCGNEYIIRG